MCELVFEGPTFLATHASWASGFLDKALKKVQGTYAKACRSNAAREVLDAAKASGHTGGLSKAEHPDLWNHAVAKCNECCRRGPKQGADACVNEVCAVEEGSVGRTEGRSLLRL